MEDEWEEMMMMNINMDADNKNIPSPNNASSQR